MFERLNDIYLQAKERLEEANKKRDAEIAAVREFNTLASKIIKELDMPEQHIRLAGVDFTISVNGVTPVPRYSQLESLEFEIVGAINIYIKKIEECE